MSTTTKHLLTALATAAFAIAAVATTATSAFAQSVAPAAAGNATGTSTAAATTGAAAKTAIATGALASAKAEQPAGLTRAQVTAEFLEARKNGQLLETEADFDVAQTRKQYAK